MIPNTSPRKLRWMLKPVPAELNMVSVWEHTPLDYYRYGEYPRFIRPPRQDCKTEWVLVDEQGNPA